jgi:hypothetical protein
VDATLLTAKSTRIGPGDERPWFVAGIPVTTLVGTVRKSSPGREAGYASRHVVCT